MEHYLHQLVDEAVRAAYQLRGPEAISFLEGCAELLSTCFKAGGKLLIAGNGGSLCDAMHFAEELTGVFHKVREPLPAIALSDTGHMSCVANDIGYEWVFARAVAAYGVAGDVLIVLTTSGRSPNLLRAVEEARRRQLSTIAFLGKGGGVLRGQADLEWCIDGFETSDRIQESQMAALHILIALIEEKLFGRNRFAEAEVSLAAR